MSTAGLHAYAADHNHNHEYMVPDMVPAHATRGKETTHIRRTPYPYLEKTMENCNQAATENCNQGTTENCNQATTENRDQAATENPRLTAIRFRPRKTELLAQIALALEGHRGREIGRILGLGKTAVYCRLQKLREERLAKMADPAEMIAFAVARYECIYREAMEASAASRLGKEIQLREDVEADGPRGGSKKKRSVRTEIGAGEVAFLAQARGSVAAICKLLPRDAPGRNKAAGPCTGRSI